MEDFNPSEPFSLKNELAAYLMLCNILIEKLRHLSFRNRTNSLNFTLDVEHDNELLLKDLSHNVRNAIIYRSGQRNVLIYNLDVVLSKIYLLVAENEERLNIFQNDSYICESCKIFNEKYSNLVKNANLTSSSVFNSRPCQSCKNNSHLFYVEQPSCAISTKTFGID